jgi:hypothetical protein
MIREILFLIPESKDQQSIEAYRVSEAHEEIRNMPDICTAIGRRLNAVKSCKRYRPAAVVESKYSCQSNCGQDRHPAILCRLRETSWSRCPAAETNCHESAALPMFSSDRKLARWLPLCPATFMNVRGQGAYECANLTYGRSF